jgi:hypothetical protein
MGNECGSAFHAQNQQISRISLGLIDHRLRGIGSVQDHVFFALISTKQPSHRVESLRFFYL